MIAVALGMPTTATSTFAVMTPEPPVTATAPSMYCDVADEHPALAAVIEAKLLPLDANHSDTVVLQAPAAAATSDTLERLM